MRISDWSSYVFSSDLLGTSALPNIQLFANVSRSAEVPSYDAGIFSSPTADMKAQRATTYEIGTRGSSGGIGWDISLYRSEIRNELQCLTLFPWAPCTTTNADRTVHQGIEVGLEDRKSTRLNSSH